VPLRHSAKILPEILAFARRVLTPQPSIVNKPDQSVKVCWDRPKSPDDDQALRGAAFGRFVGRAEHESIPDIIVRKHFAQKVPLHSLR
jgi:hypothetical protein